MATKPDDGGPAFPQNDLSAYGMGPAEGSQCGLSVRDYFAGQALPGLMERWGPSTIKSSDEIAGFAYQMADAMLRARQS